jgi:Na+-driven multidrug efflux pump
MKGLSNPARKRRRVAIDAAMLLVIIVLMVQMWLLTATLESYLAGHHDVALPGFVSSFVLFGICAFLYWLVLRIDRMKEKEQVSEGTARPGPWKIGEPQN